MNSVQCRGKVAAVLTTVQEDGLQTMHSDEPVSLLGTDALRQPAEYILKALTGCYMVTLASLAAGRNIPLKQVALTLEFDID